MKRIVVLGATGSIGENTLRLVAGQRDQFQVVGLSAHRKESRLLALAREFDVPAVAITSPSAGMQHSPPAPVKRVFSGDDAAAEMLRQVDFDLCIHGITGAAGLAPSYVCLQKGKALGLANKESLVIAGELLMSVSRAKAAPIIPVDSEHSAIYQCVRHEPRSRIRKIYLTASGGPFRDRALDTFDAITPAEALRHPNWDMGERITVGSATMMNKAFEVVEAHHLFQLQKQQIRVLIHRQSIVHSMAEFEDASILAQLGVPDMRIPIQVALHHPGRGRFDFEAFDPVKFSNLTFADADPGRYPALELGYHCLDAGGTSGAILNAADEVATRRFLDGTLQFTDIARLCRAALERIPIRAADSLQSVFEADQQARNFALEYSASSHKANPWTPS